MEGWTAWSPKSESCHKPRGHHDTQLTTSPVQVQPGARTTQATAPVPGLVAGLSPLTQLKAEELCSAQYHNALGPRPQHRVKDTPPADQSQQLTVLRTQGSRDVRRLLLSSPGEVA